MLDLGVSPGSRTPSLSEPAAKSVSASRKRGSRSAHRENSEVDPSGAVAVAVTFLPAGTATLKLNVALPLPLVEADVDPSQVSPSPNPDPLHFVFA